MKDEVFLIASPALLDSVVKQIEPIPMEHRDTKGNLYEYMLSKLSTEGTNGQFRIPRHTTKVGVQQAGTDFVWFYDMVADGLSLDDKCQPVEV